MGLNFKIQILLIKEKLNCVNKKGGLSPENDRQI